MRTEEKHREGEIQSARGLTQPCAGLEMEVALLTGGGDRHYKLRCRCW